MDKMYLGDGAYVEVDRARASLVIYTHNGVRRTNEVVLDDLGMHNLLTFINQLKINHGKD